MKKMMLWPSLGIALVILCVGVGAAPAEAPALKPLRIQSSTQLLQLLRKHQPRYYAGYRTGLLLMADALAPSAGTSSTVPVSTTLTQVAGVDEGDCVKTDGTVIFQINQGRVLAIQGRLDASLVATNSLDFSHDNFYPQELYLIGPTLVVVGNSFRNPPVGPLALRPIWYFSTSTVAAKVYDVSTPAAPVKIREVEIDGDYIATRMVGNQLYLVARQYPNYYALANAGVKSATTGIVPAVRDTARSKVARSLALKNCFYFPGFDDPNYLIVAGVDVANPQAPAQVNAYLGAGDQIYSSTQNLYVAGSRSQDIFFMEPLLLSATPALTSTSNLAKPLGAMAAMVAVDPVLPIYAPTNREQTVIYQFALNNGRPTFVAAGTVPGSVRNSYAMDEFDNTFRVATTEHAWWGGTQADRNNLFVLNTTPMYPPCAVGIVCPLFGAMTVIGSVTNLAAGEQIYATRFLGNRAFLVTYHQIDPLFAIDLTDPTQPVVVGQLTLPGYSQFLLPYDETHLIGIGKDATIAVNQTGGDVPWWNGAAFYQGLKVALFDVTDLRNPTLLTSVSIGDRGTDSPVLWDPHALLFDRSRNLLAFPVSVAKVTNPDPTLPWQWGDTVFQGVYVYDVSVTNGLVLRGTISQIPAGASIWSNWSREINRVVFVGNSLFTLSDAAVQANDFRSLAQTTLLELPQPPQSNVGPIIFQPILQIGTGANP